LWGREESLNSTEAQTHSETSLRQDLSVCQLIPAHNIPACSLKLWDIGPGVC